MIEIIKPSEISGMTTRAEKNIPGLFELIRQHEKGIPIKSRNIEKLLLITGDEVRAIVAYLRQNRQPVCSDSNGYYWGTEREHLEHTIAQLRSRIDKIGRAVLGLEYALLNFDKQPTHQDELNLSAGGGA